MERREVGSHGETAAMKTKQLVTTISNQQTKTMTLQELIEESREQRDQRGGDCAVIVVLHTEDGARIEGEVLNLRADTTTGTTIIEIICE